MLLEFQIIFLKHKKQHHEKFFLSNFSFLFKLFLFQKSNTPSKVIELRNPSFEDTPKPSVPPNEWENCGCVKETPPDVHPTEGYRYGVPQFAIDGETYVGMVVRENDTWESIGQNLSKPLEKDKC